ncbi:hypothetical protein WI372_07850 [Gemmatimonadota bacterium DH-20]|uniref:Polysaccharide biosynthesis domain-containing protein n=1 Tax=Gaopeijia maritima TaxID=3119007 RepID=A0ABU9E8P6_9BACT
MTDHSIDPDQDLRDLVASNPGQGTFEEYRHLRNVIRAKAPARVLIFGVGRDSQYWLDANEGGTTVFVEHEPTWIGMTRDLIPGVDVVQVSYDTVRTQWKALLERRDLLFMDDLPDRILAENWDVIFVDSPQGGSRRRPGRMKSIYTASVLARRSTDVEVLVHDCHRPVEATYAHRYLGAERMVEQVAGLRHYRLRPPVG